jgi:hypothetical protein
MKQLKDEWLEMNPNAEEWDFRNFYDSYGG